MTFEGYGIAGYDLELSRHIFIPGYAESVGTRNDIPNPLGYADLVLLDDLTVLDPRDSGVRGYQSDHIDHILIEAQIFDFDYVFFGDRRGIEVHANRDNYACFACKGIKPRYL